MLVSPKVLNYMLLDYKFYFECLGYFFDSLLDCLVGSTLFLY